MAKKAVKTHPKAIPEWFYVLKLARKVAEVGVLTAETLGSELKPPPGARSDAGKLASGWLGKFVRWGYATRTGSAAGEKRWVRTFELTETGLTRGEPTGRMVFEQS